jgi:hypothetical protein
MGLLNIISACKVGPLSPQRDESTASGSGRQFPGIIENVAANIINKQSWTVDKDRPSNFGFGPHRKFYSVTKRHTRLRTLDKEPLLRKLNVLSTGFLCPG